MNDNYLNPNNDISRRKFLWKSAMTACAPLFITPKSIFPAKNQISKPLARVFSDNTPIHRLPEASSKIIRLASMNEVIEMEPIKDMPCALHISNQWAAVLSGGFIRITDAQMVENNLNDVRMDLVKGSALAEISVPFTQAWKAKNSGIKGFELFYYGSTHWVTGLAQDEESNYYYKIVDDRWDTISYIDARHARIIESGELEPINPDVGDKRIEVSIKDQQVYAFEGDKLVFTSKTATGIINAKSDYSTPKGIFRINYKRPSRHMVHTDRIGQNDDDLYGVPWVSYFTDTGVAFHGTYWHNRFYEPRSHGCVNLPIYAAKWIYLWSLPQVPPRERTYVSRQGTTVHVF